MCLLVTIIECVSGSRNAIIVIGFKVVACIVIDLIVSVIGEIVITVLRVRSLVVDGRIVNVNKRLVDVPGKIAAGVTIAWLIADNPA